MQHHSLMIAVATLGLAACGPGPDAVWLVNVGTEEIVSSDVDCQENLNTSDCPTEGEPPDSDWTRTRERSVSDGAFFAQILDGPKGEKVLVANGEVYVGEKDGGAWLFQWEGQETNDSVDKHISGYEYSVEETLTTTTVFRLDLSGGTATGEMVTEVKVDTTVTESDEWIAEDIGYSFGQLFNELPFGLTGDNTNTSTEQDCAAGDCTIAITATQETSAPISAIRTDAGADGFEGVYDAGQESGADNDF